MELNQPTPSVPVSNELKNAIESAKNQVTILQAESDRLLKLAQQTKIEIANLNDQRVSLEKAIASGEERKETLQAEIATFSDSLMGQKNDLMRARDEIATQTTVITSDRAKIDAESKKLDQDQFLFTEEKKQFIQDKANLALESATLDSKKRILADALSKL
jgi:chromosome segregation ATPase